MNDADKILGERPIGPLDYDPFWDGINWPRHFDRQGNQISMRDWCRLKEFAGKEYHAVKQETIGCYYLSTVWMGINHGFGHGEPLIFETMAFWQGEGEEPDWGGLDTWRYSTEAEAIAGHERVAEQLRLFVSVE